MRNSVRIQLWKFNNPVLDRVCSRVKWQIRQQVDEQIMLTISQEVYHQVRDRLCHPVWQQSGEMFKR